MRTSWPQAERKGNLILQPFGSLSEYQEFLTGRHYSALLIDGALLQFSFDYKEDEMVGHRYCYYPCPLVLPDQSYASDIDAWFDLLDNELLAEIDAHASVNAEAGETIELSTNARLRLRSPIRVDYAPDAAKPGEPACHLHINDGDVRVPVYAALSIREFMLFISEHFYPSYAHLFEPLAKRKFDRCITVDDELKMHISCRQTLAS